jgi:DNA-binding NtrC family response regulator
VSPATQVKLLRVLDTSTFRHVGGTAEIRVDVRVLAATNRDLAVLVRQGHFREDLFYRLGTITLHLPPLRERGADVELLAKHFLSRLNERYGFAKSFAPEAMNALRRHDWPGNVRELLHVIEAAVVACEGNEISPAHLPAALRAGSSPAAAVAAGDGAPLTLEQMERAYIERILVQVEGHRGRAARLLGISERNLYRKLREYGLAG